MGMPTTITSQFQTKLLFHSLQMMYEFKHEIACNEFYVERDVITFVGFFTKEQVDLAVIKYNAVATPVGRARPT
jgi:hypothetical protein